MSAPLIERLRAKADTYANRVECAASLECEAADTITDLLAALEYAINVLNGMNDDEINEELLPYLRAAIAKAKGGAA